MEFQLRIAGVTIIREPGFGWASSMAIKAAQSLRESRGGSVGGVALEVAG
jgi:hypothetical protein